MLDFKRNKDIVYDFCSKNISQNLNHWNYINRYSKWMFHLYSDYIGETVFDVGAGMGRMVEFYIESVKNVVAIDIFQNQINYMNKRFQNYSYFRAIKKDILKDDLSEYKGCFDTVICINVLEHLSNDFLAVKNMRSILRDEGTLILMVPAFQKLYCQLDINVNHYRRYNPGRLCNIARKNGMRVVKHHYFNMMGIIPYWIKGKKKLKKDESFSSSLNEYNSKIYNFAAGIFEPIEKYFPPKVGLTEFMVLRR